MKASAPPLEKSEHQQLVDALGLKALKYCQPSFLVAAGYVQARLMLRS